jgi:hypothetical protein
MDMHATNLTQSDKSWHLEMDIQMVIDQRTLHMKMTFASSVIIKLCAYNIYNGINLSLLITFVVDIFPSA